MLGAMLRFAAAVALGVGAVLGAAEVGLRLSGVGPRVAGEESHLVPDAWTGFRLRPGVPGPEAFVTNDLGMHAPRTYSLDPPPASLRVAVLGSSVVYGLDLPLAETIPGVLERELLLAGRRAEVLNFGTHAFTIVHLSALLQAYVHQLRPDVVVVVLDLQVGLPRWPSVHPGTAADTGIETLGPWAGLVKRASARSALLGLFDDPRPARRFVRRATGLPLRPPSQAGAPRPGEDAPSPRAALPPAAAPIPAPLAAAPDVGAYEARRERDLAAPLRAMAAFCAEKSIAFYLVTPYGPYFDLTEEELSRMSVQHFLEEAARVHGGARAALRAEVELITRVARRVADPGPARVLDMLEASRRASLRGSPHFTEDGVHLSPAGNRALGRLIAERIAEDFSGPPPRD
jgi:lysophospholipase L1-like esterase